MSISRIPAGTKPHITRDATGSNVVVQPRGVPGPPGAGASNSEVAAIVTTAGATRNALDARYASQQVADLIAGRFPIKETRKLIGPVAAAPDNPTVTHSASADGTYNQSYIISSNAYPAGWPFDLGVGNSQIVSNYSYPNPLLQVRLIRFLCDGTKFALRTDGTAPSQGYFMFVNGAPVSLSMSSFGSSGTFTTVVFSDARPRYIEILTTAGFQGAYCAKPYRIWAPPPLTGPKVLLVGDSYSAGVTMDGTDSTESARMNGFAPTLGLHLGIDRFTTDGIGGTGFIEDSGAGSNNYNDRLASHIALAPDVLIVGGGGANDFYNGGSSTPLRDVATVTAAAKAYLLGAREGLPDAKLVFIEGFSPPNGYSTFNDEYTAVRAALQDDDDIEAAGVYFIDVSTSSAWLDGAGWKGAASGAGNSDLYVGGDGVHPTIPGHRYIRERLAPKLRLVLADDGDLVGTLI